ncbi:MAG: hydrogenase maturation nickel metallochaperone HypA [bacterium]|nr:hydrogenase maturation nickel metallochaperone HypA [bacterium]
MHESSVAKEIFDIVNDVVMENTLVRVDKIVIELGEFSCIQQQMLSFAFQMIAEGTIMEKAVLEYEIVKATARCENCGTIFDITFTDKVCPSCGTVSTHFLTGTEANVKEIEGD